MKNRSLLLLIILGVVVLGGWGIWRVSQSQNDAEAVFAQVVAPYLALNRAGDYARAIDAHTAEVWRERHDAADLAVNYAAAEAMGGVVGVELRQANQGGNLFTGETHYTFRARLLMGDEGFILARFDVVEEAEALRIAASWSTRAQRLPGPW